MGQPKEEQSAVARVRARRKAHRRRKTARKALLACALVAAIAVPYAVGHNYFSTHYFPRTGVGSIDASGMTEDELAQAIDAVASSYRLGISNGSFDCAVTGPSIGLTCNGEAVARELMARQDVTRWPVALFADPVTRDLGVEFSRKKLNTQVREAVEAYNKTAKEAQPAGIRYDREAQAFVTEAEVPGEVLDAGKVCHAAADAVVGATTSLLLDDDALVAPSIVADSKEMRDALHHANACLELTVPLMHKGKQVASIGPELLGRWIKVREDLSTTVDERAVVTWTNEYLWQSLDYANDVAVMSVDAPTLAKRLAKAVATEGDGKVEVPYTVTPRYIPGAGKLARTKWRSDLGRYIDVDKKAQVATLFDSTGRVLWESEVTTGNEANGDGTPTGEFGIYDKVTDFVLVGHDKNNDGKPDYESHVDYWMPFNGNIGLHDASWREVFGGDEYRANGSGGCVNLPVQAAAQLFAMTHINEVVIVHE